MLLRRFLSALIVIAVAVPVAAQVSFNSTTYPGPSNTSPGFAIAADIDRDGNPDIITTDGSNPQLLVWYGTGEGKFGSPELIGHLDGVAGDIAVGDFNNDGKLDMIATGTQSQFIDILINEGNRTFSVHSIHTTSMPSWIAVADFNNDGNLDFAVSLFNQNTNANSIQIFLGDGKGGFTAGQVVTGLPFLVFNLIARDLNKDGKVDLVDVGAPATILLNNGDGTFKIAQTLKVPNGGTYTYGSAGDVNGDAVPDLFLTNNQFCGEGCGFITSLDSWVNDGTGHFTLKQSLQPTGSSDDFGLLADINYEGKLDMVFESDSVLEYALGKGNGMFGAVEQLGSLKGEFVGDFNPLLNHDLKDDGQMDIVSTSGDSDLIQVELNTSAKPDCLPPNSSAVGSTVCSPASGQEVDSIFAVRAAANGPVDILRMEEWIDGKKVFQSLSNQLRNNLTTSVGRHELTIVTVDVLNNVSKKDLSLLAISCSAPATAGVRICTPATGAKVSSPVSVVAASNPPSGTSITAVRLYIDNVARNTTSGSRLSTSVALAAGLHHLTVVAYEADGHALTASETITVH